MYRDIAVLLAIRPFFRHTVFHFHAGGLTELYPQLSPTTRILFSRAYARPDCAIILSNLNPPDGSRLHARRNFTIPNGIEDNYSGFSRRVRNGQSAPNILFVGALSASKGVMVLLEACQLLNRRGLQFRAQLMGAFSSDAFERKAREYVEENNLQKHISFLGVRSGQEKWQSFAEADIFCFPSFYECETFGLVLLEAMQFELPIVSTHWRGIPSIVRDGENGYLVPPQDPDATANQLENLIRHPDCARTMGERGRQIFLRDFTIERWRSRMESALVAAARVSIGDIDFVKCGQS